MDDVFSCYASAAPTLIDRFEAVAPQQLYAPLADLLPRSPVRVADIGAGTGRDAAWFADLGHAVLAVEPVAELRAAGLRLHPSPRIVWLDDRLPELAALRTRGPFDLVTLCAVWHHLDAEARRIAILGLAAIVAPGGLLIVSLRHGPELLGRPVFPVPPEETVAAASAAGFSLLRRVETESIQAANQAAGVRWTWLALRKI